MSLKNKASKIDLNLGSPPQPSQEVPAVVEALEDAPRRKSGVAAIQQSIGTMHRLADLEAEVTELRSAERTMKLDPASIRQSKWRNRLDQSFAGKAFERFKEEIAHAGGNIQPIKVRRVRLDGGVEFFEIVYGRRRLRACLELGLPVNAIVCEMSEADAYIEAERENRNREDLTPWEQGIFFLDALEQGLFSSQRKLATTLGVAQSLVSDAVKLASLPQSIVDAFQSPLDLQYRWGAALNAAMGQDAQKVEAEAKLIAGMTPRPSARAVVERLVHAVSSPANAVASKSDLMKDGKKVGSLLVDQNGLTLKLKASIADRKFDKELRDLLKRYTSSGE